MLKWLFWLILVLVFWGIVRSRAQARSRYSSRVGSNGQRMVPCHFCEVHVPESEAVEREEKRFCCERHYHQWKRSA